MTKPSLSAMQSVIGLLAGVISIVGGTYSLVKFFEPSPSFGEVVAVVREARTDRPVPDATIEIYTRENALVTTLAPAGNGRARQPLKEGPYRLRVSHPRFGAEVRQIQVLSGQTAEVRIQLTQRTGGSSPLGSATRAVTEGAGAVERFIRGFRL